MGSQVNFFLGPSDLRTLASVISSVEDAVFLYWLSDTPRPVEVSEIVPDYGNEQLRVLVARRQDLGAMTFRPREGHSDYRGDIHRNLVFEFDRPFVSTEFIRAGRLYRDDNYWLPGGLSARKQEDWIAWGKRLFAKCRRSLTYVDGGFYYAGEEALKMRQNGVLFQDLDDPKGLVAKMGQ